MINYKVIKELTRLQLLLTETEIRNKSFIYHKVFNTNIRLWLATVNNALYLSVPDNSKFLSNF